MDIGEDFHRDTFTLGTPGPDAPRNIEEAKQAVDRLKDLFN